MLNHRDTVKRADIQHDLGACGFGGFEQAKRDEPPNDVRMQPETSCRIFERNQIASCSENRNCVIHLLPAMTCRGSKRDSAASFSNSSRSAGESDGGFTI